MDGENNGKPDEMDDLGVPLFSETPISFQTRNLDEVFWSPETSSFSGKTGENFFWVPFSSDSRPPQSDWWAAARTAGGPPKKTHEKRWQVGRSENLFGFQHIVSFGTRPPIFIAQVHFWKRLETSSMWTTESVWNPLWPTFSLRFPVVASTLGITQCGGKGLPKRHDKMPQATKEYKGS